jgi:hypothetical protein
MVFCAQNNVFTLSKKHVCSCYRSPFCYHFEHCFFNELWQRFRLHFGGPLASFSVDFRDRLVNEFSNASCTAFGAKLHPKGIRPEHDFSNFFDLVPPGFLLMTFVPFWYPYWFPFGRFGLPFGILSVDTTLKY